MGFIETWYLSIRLIYGSELCQMNRIFFPDNKFRIKATFILKASKQSISDAVESKGTRFQSHRKFKYTSFRNNQRKFQVNITPTHWFTCPST